MSSKGITPVIATVLLLMMTVSAAAGAYYWITTVQGNLQEQAQGAIIASGVSGNYRVSILSGGTTCVGSTNDITLYVKNSGPSDIPAGNWYIFVKNTQGVGVGTWINNSAVGVFNADSTTSIDFDLSGSGGISSGNSYTLQLNAPKGASATGTCRAD